MLRTNRLRIVEFDSQSVSGQKKCLDSQAGATTLLNRTKDYKYNLSGRRGFGFDSPLRLSFPPESCSPEVGGSRLLGCWPSGSTHSCISRLVLVVPGENLAFHDDKMGGKEHCRVTTGRIKARNSAERLSVYFTAHFCNQY